MKVIKKNPEYVNSQICDFECPECGSTLREDKREMAPTGGWSDGIWIYEFRCPVCRTRQVIRADQMRPIR